MAKKALGEIPGAKVAPKREPKAKAKGDAPNTTGYGPKKQPPHKVNKRRVLFIADEFFDPVKERAAAETKQRGVTVSPSEIIREAITVYLNL